MVLLKPLLLHVHLFITVDVLTIYLKNVSLICRYTSLLFNINNFYYYAFGSLIEDFLQCHKIQNNFLLILRGFNSGKDFFPVSQKLNLFCFKVDIKIRNLMDLFNFEELKLQRFWN